MEAKLRILLLEISDKNQKVFLPLYYWLFWKINGTFWRHFFMLYFLVKKKIQIWLVVFVGYLRM